MQDELINNIGVRIKAIREAKKKDQEPFGKSIGVGRTTVLNWESGDVDPTKKSKPALELLCKVYNVNEQYLYEGIGEMFLEEQSSNKSIIDEFLLRQLELKDHTIETLQSMVNHLLGVPGKPNVHGGAESRPIIPLWGTNPGTELSLVA